MDKKDTRVWQEYFERTRGSPPRPLLVRALAHLRHTDRAIDLGAGALNESKYLLEQGFNQVTAVDKVPVAESVARHLPSDRFTYVISSFERFSYPKASVDLVNAQYALPFNPPETFGNVLRAINNSLRKGGIFTGQFFGDRDEWNVAGTQMTFHTRDQAIEALSPFKTIDLQEIDRDRSAASGSMKHWHLFEFIVAKR